MGARRPGLADHPAAGRAGRLMRGALEGAGLLAVAVAVVAAVDRLAALSPAGFVVAAALPAAVAALAGLAARGRGLGS